MPGPHLTAATVGRAKGFSGLMNRLKALWLFVLFASVSTGQAETRTIWHIGQFDGSPLEFSSKPKDSVTFEVGKSNPKEDWSGYQGVGHPYKILFSLDSLKGVYSLRIAVLTVQPRLPTLGIQINGHSGQFFPQPRLSYFPGDVESAFHPNNSQSNFGIEVPSSFLNTGVNSISITAIDDPRAVGEEQSSGIAYDAVSLEQNTSRTFDANRVLATLKPTVFYRRKEAGLVETVDAFITSNGRLQAGTAELQMQDKRYIANFSRGQEFGEQRISFEVPEWTGVIRGKLYVHTGSLHTFDVTLTSERKWTIFVVPHTHLDIGYTDFQGKVAETQARVLTQAADLIHQHPDFRFSIDGSWNLEQLLGTRSRAKQDEILGLIQSGRMAMPAQYCNLLTGYASLETLYRSLYQSKALAHRYGLPFEYANITDVPTYSGSYPSVLASSGVKYWVAAANNYRAPLLYHNHWNEESPFWWEGPDGRKVLVWYSWAYLQVQTLFGLPPQVEAGRESLPIYLQAYSKPSYKPDVALIYGTQVENTDLFPSTATFADEWNKMYAYPVLKYATFPDFFHYIEKSYAKDLPTFKGDGGGYWEDGIGSDAYFAAEDRQNQHRALSAEILSTLTHSIDANFNPPTGLFQDIWRNMILFAEHTWLSYNSVVQPDHQESIKQLRVKDARADRASLEIEDVMNRSLSQLADQIHIPANTLVVFNSLNWSRDAIMETDLFEHPTLVDLTTHQQVPFEILYEKEKFLHVRFLAKDLPAVGYKCFSITYGEQGPAPQQSVSQQTVENSFYRIKVDESSGAISSIYDKQLQREIVDPHSSYKFGQYLYVTGGDGDAQAGNWETVLAYGGTQMTKSFLSLPKAELNISSSSTGRLLGVKRLPWGDSIRMTSSGVNTPKIETEILLFNDYKKIEFRYRIHKDYTTRKEGVYLAFPVAVSAPQFSFATQQGWIDPARDLMKGGSLEWFNIQEWMAVHDANLALGIVPVDAPLASFGDINRGKWPGEFRPKSGTIFSYVMNNYWDTNYRAGQGGDFVFRYVITSAAQLNGGALTRLGTEEMRPAEVDYVVSQDKIGDPPRPLPAEGEDFVETSGEGVILGTWKKAEDGNGTILRFQETSGRPNNTTVRFLHLKIASARLCSGVENDKENLPVDHDSIRLSFRPFEVLTVRIVGQ